MDNIDQDLFRTTPNQYIASKEKRIVNFAIDFIAYTFIAGMVWDFTSGFIDAFGGAEFLADLKNLNSIVAWILQYIGRGLVMVAYYIIVEHNLNGRSLGKFVTKTRAVQRSGKPMTLDMVVKRSFTRMIPFNALSFLGQLKDGWHDSICDTTVVHSM